MAPGTQEDWLESVRNVVSAMCTQLESGGRINCRVGMNSSAFSGIQSLVNESHDVSTTVNVVCTGASIPGEGAGANTRMVWTAIPHSGQLNITTSILSTTERSHLSSVRKWMTLSQW